MHFDFPSACCIERKIEYIGDRQLFSVREYERTREKTVGLSPRASAFWGIFWALEAPAVEKLTTDWPCEGPKVRICDWELYCTQMNKLLGIA